MQEAGDRAGGESARVRGTAALWLQLATKDALQVPKHKTAPEETVTCCTLVSY